MKANRHRCARPALRRSPRFLVAVDQPPIEDAVAHTDQGRPLERMEQHNKAQAEPVNSNSMTQGSAPSSKEREDYDHIVYQTLNVNRKNGSPVTQLVCAVRSPFFIADAVRWIQDDLENKFYSFGRCPSILHLLAGMISPRHPAGYLFKTEHILLLRRLLLRLGALQLRRVISLTKPFNNTAATATITGKCNMEVVQKHMEDNGAVAMDGTTYFQSKSGILQGRGNVIFGGILNPMDSFDRDAWDLLLGLPPRVSSGAERFRTEACHLWTDQEIIPPDGPFAFVPTQDDIAHLWENAAVHVQDIGTDRGNRKSAPSESTEETEHLLETLGIRARRTRAIIDLTLSWILTEMNCDNEFRTCMALHRDGGHFIKPYNGTGREQPYISFSASVLANNHGERAPGYLAICTGTESMTFWVSPGSHHHVARAEIIKTTLPLKQILIPPFSVFVAHGQLVIASGSDDDKPHGSSGRAQYFATWAPECEQRGLRNRIRFGQRHGTKGTNFSTININQQQASTLQEDVNLSELEKFSQRAGKISKPQGDFTSKDDIPEHHLTQDDTSRSKIKKLNADDSSLDNELLGKSETCRDFQTKKPSSLIRHESEFPGIPFD